MPYVARGSCGVHVDGDIEREVCDCCGSVESDVQTGGRRLLDAAAAVQRVGSLSNLTAKTCWTLLGLC